MVDYIKKNWIRFTSENTNCDNCKLFILYFINHSAAGEHWIVCPTIEWIWSVRCQNKKIHGVWNEKNSHDQIVDSNLINFDDISISASILIFFYIVFKCFCIRLNGTILYFRFMENAWKAFVYAVYFTYELSPEPYACA